MSYIQDNLGPNEKILFSAKVSPAVFMPSIILLIGSCGFLIAGAASSGKGGETGGIMGMFLQIIAVILLFYAMGEATSGLILLQTTEFAVTNRKVIAKTGFIRRHTLELLLSRVESVAINQSVLGRIFNFGYVTVVGTGGTRETFKLIKDPVNVRSQINTILEQYMQAYTEHQRQKSPTA